MSLRRLLSRLTALALTTSAIGPAAAAVPNANVTDEELDELEIDHDQIGTDEAALALGRGLALAMAEMRPLVATQLAATWSLAPDPLRRLALGVALEWTFPLVGDALVIDHLARDPEPRVRAAAARAAWMRRPTGGDLGVLDRLASDPDPAVRAVANAGR